MRDHIDIGGDGLLVHVQRIGMSQYQQPFFRGRFSDSFQGTGRQ